MNLISHEGGRRAFVKHIDGNACPTCKIGSQVWMAANLRAKNCMDRKRIPSTGSFDDGHSARRMKKYGPYH